MEGEFAKESSRGTDHDHVPETPPTTTLLFVIIMWVALYFITLSPQLNKRGLTKTEINRQTVRQKVGRKTNRVVVK